MRRMTKDTFDARMAHGAPAPMRRIISGVYRGCARARSIAETMALRQRGQFLESGFALGIPHSLVPENSRSGNTAVAADFGQLRNLRGLEQLDQIRTRDVEKIGCFLGRQRVVVLDDADMFAGKQQLGGLLDDARQVINELGHALRRCRAGGCATDNGGDGAR
jgi:hypothetical protein